MLSRHGAITAIDDRTRVAYSEILNDEQGTTAAEFWRRARDWFKTQGVTIERCLTDNRSCYRSRLWATPRETLTQLVGDTLPAEQT